jgi:ubiquinone/menaquinone biosynthesis C-methylase UbiE
MIFNRLLSFLLQAFFHLLYQQFAWAYDWVANFVSVGRWRQWITYIHQFIQGPNVLEIGHGPGYLQVSLAEKGLRIVGLDKSAQMGKIAKHNFSHRFSRQDIFHPNLVRGCAEMLPFQSGQYETVVATFPTEYIFLPETLAEVYRVLCYSGKLVILLSARITGTGLMDRLALFLFRVTGQVLSDNMDANRLLSPFIQVGLISRLEWVDTPTDRLLFIIAEKPTLIK